MRSIATKIKDCVLLDNIKFEDHRGVFSEIFKQSRLDFFPKQTNYSYSHQGVFRGIHRTPYAKVVTCVKGSVFDVCVDLRQDSDTYNQYYGVELSETNLMSLYIPPYCGHGFLALQDSILIYQQEREYHKDLDESFCYKNFNIVLPMNIKDISERDNC